MFRQMWERAKAFWAEWRETRRQRSAFYRAERTNLTFPQKVKWWMNWTLGWVLGIPLTLGTIVVGLHMCVEVIVGFAAIIAAWILGILLSGALEWIAYGLTWLVWKPAMMIKSLFSRKGEPAVAKA